MRITDPDIIRTGENDLINSVKNDLDWDAVKEIIKNRINMKSFESKGGEIVVVDGKIAFRIDLELKMTVNLMFDRDGNYIEDEPVAEPDIPDMTDLPQKTGASQEIDFVDQSDSEEQEVTDDDFDLDSAVPDAPVSDIADDSDDDFDFEFDEDRISKPEDISDKKSGNAPQEGIVSSGIDDAFDNDFDEDIDDILEETRELWKNKE